MLKSVAPQVWELLAPRVPLLGVGFILLVINRSAALLAPYAPKLLLDRVIARRDVHFLPYLGAGLVAAVVVQAFTTYLLSQLFAKEGQRLVAELRCKVQAHIVRLPVTYYDSNRTGALQSRIMNDVEGVRSLIGLGLVEFAGGVCTAVFVLFIMLRMSPLLTGVAAGFFLLFGFIWKRNVKSLRPIYRDRSATTADITGRLTESLGGIRVVKGYHAEDREDRVFAEGIQRLLQIGFRVIQKNSRMNMATTIDMGVMGACVMTLGAVQILAGKMTTGDLFSYAMFMAYLSTPIIQLSVLGTTLIEALAGLDRTREVLAESPEDKDPERTIALPQLRGHLRFEHVDFEYEAEKPVLKDISFDASPGSVTALVGSSGSGKSTIIGLVASFYKPTRGTVLIDGIDLSRVRIDSYRPMLGLVLQDSFLFAGTIRENVGFSRPTSSADELLNACRVAHVDEFAERFKNGYETVIGERGVKLSGGQRQRMAIARAILADPKILILDEATSSLDSESEIFIQQGLKYLMAGRTTFVIAHRLSTIRQADQILVVEDGRIMERGTHASLYEQHGRYFELYKKQYGLESNLFRDPSEENELAGKVNPASVNG
jgi:subfamily B ATP-binding cassette protein MsbA